MWPSWNGKYKPTNKIFALHYTPSQDNNFHSFQDDDEDVGKSQYFDCMEAIPEDANAEQEEEENLQEVGAKDLEAWHFNSAWMLWQKI